MTSKEYKKLLKNQRKAFEGEGEDIFDPDEQLMSVIDHIEELNDNKILIQSGAVGYSSKKNFYDYWFKGKSRKVTDTVLEGRSFLAIYVPELSADSFHSKLMHTDLVVFTAPVSYKYHSSYETIVNVISFTYKGKRYSEIPGSYQINYDPVGLNNTFDTHNWSSLSKETVDKLKKEVRYFFILDPKWGRDYYLFDKVREAIIKD